MRLLELVLQGVKGFPAQARIALGTGHCVLRAPATAQLRPLFAALLFYDGRPGPDDQRLEAPGAPAVRVGLSFQAKDGFTYRLVRDLRGGAALHRLDGASGRFVPFTQDAPEIAQYLRTAVGLPPRSLWDDIFVMSADRLPTMRRVDDEQAAAAPKPLSKFAQALADKAAAKGAKLVAEPSKGAGFRGWQGSAELDPSAVPETAGALSPEQARERIPLVEKEVAAAKRSEQLQFQLDGANGKLFKLEEQLRELNKVEAELAGAKKQLEEHAALDRLPADIGARIQVFEGAGQKRAEAQAKIDAEREFLEERAANANPIPVQSDPRFAGPLVAGLALLGAALFSSWKLLALLDIPVFGVAAWFAVRYVSDLQARDGLARKRAMLAEREKKLEEAFEAAAGDVKAALKLLDIERTSELVERVGARDAAKARAEGARARLEQMKADPAFQAALSEQAQLKTEIAQVEKELGAGGSGFVRPAADIERELAKLRDVASGSAPAPSAPAPKPEPERLEREPSGSFQVPPEAKATGPDLSQKLVERGADLFQLELKELIEAIQPRAGQYLMALSDRRYDSFSFTTQGGAVCEGPGRKLAFPELPGRDRDLAWLSLQMTLVERFSARFKLPFVLDDPFSLLDEPRLPLAGKMAKFLGGHTQVVHRTTLPALVAAADSVVELA